LSIRSGWRATPQPVVAINPLQWTLAVRDGAESGVVFLERVLREVQAAGFDAVMADIPSGMPVSEYRDRLAAHGLRPAPGYFAASFEQTPELAVVTESARRCAHAHAELGLTEIFVAGAMTGARLRRPAVGAGFDQDTLSRFTENLGRVAEAVVEEGLQPCLHPHVGTLVETEHEVRFVLDTVDRDVMAFGPDTGHLFWGGMDPAAVVADYAARVRAVHVKDVHRHVARSASDQQMTYEQATVHAHVWTEPGRGDVDLAAVLDALGDHTGWWLMEVDVPDRTTPQVSASLSAAWAKERLTAPRPLGVTL
jgi:inosose dehydratase